MKIGIISDTHDNLDNLSNAVSRLNSEGVEHVFHAGDFTSPFTSRVIKNLKAGFTGIFGNNDGDKLLLREMFNGNIFNQPYQTTIGGKRLVMVHEPYCLDALRDSGHFDIIIYGHTHEPVVKEEKGVLIVNPGELSGWLYKKPSFVVLELDTMRFEIIYL